MTVQIYGWFYINNFEFIDIYVHFLCRQETPPDQTGREPKKATRNECFYPLCKIARNNTKVVSSARLDKRKRLLFISTQFSIHPHAGPPFREARPQLRPVPQRKICLQISFWISTFLVK